VNRAGTHLHTHRWSASLCCDSACPVQNFPRAEVAPARLERGFDAWRSTACKLDSKRVQRMEPLTERLAEQQPIRQEGEGCRDASGSGRAAETLREHAEAHSSAVRDASNKMDAFAGRWVLHESTGLDAFLHVSRSPPFTAIGLCDDDPCFASAFC
jgi:hypothetical protein